MGQGISCFRRAARALAYTGADKLAAVSANHATVGAASDTGSAFRATCVASGIDSTGGARPTVNPESGAAAWLSGNEVAARFSATGPSCRCNSLRSSCWVPIHNHLLSWGSAELAHLTGLEPASPNAQGWCFCRPLSDHFAWNSATDTDALENVGVSNWLGGPMRGAIDQIKLQVHELLIEDDSALLRRQLPRIENSASWQG